MDTIMIKTIETVLILIISDKKFKQKNSYTEKTTKKRRSR
jgi:hypothetical protein